MTCHHNAEVTIEPISRGPKTTISCGMCGAKWEVDSWLAVLLRFVLWGQEALGEQLDSEEE